VPETRENPKIVRRFAFDQFMFYPLTLIGS